MPIALCGVSAYVEVLLCCRLGRKMPIKAQEGNLNVDMKAIGRVIWRSTILHIFR